MRFEVLEVQAVGDAPSEVLVGKAEVWEDSL